VTRGKIGGYSDGKGIMAPDFQTHGAIILIIAFFTLSIKGLWMTGFEEWWRSSSPSSLR
ncbi:Hypothetical protein FKW44_005192, partial [Caligus rogercresseyi]